MHEKLLIKTIVVAHIILLLSIFSKSNKQRVAVASVGLAVVVSISLWKEYITGYSSLGFLIFNLTIFVYVSLISIYTLLNIREISKEK